MRTIGRRKEEMARFNRKSRILLFVVAAVLAIPALVYAVPGTGGRTRFHAVVNCSVTHFAVVEPGPPGAPPNVARVFWVGRARIFRLGNFQVVGNHTSDETTGRPSSGRVEGSILFTHEVTGDRIFAVFNGTKPRPAFREGDLTILAGTGRYAGATGQATFGSLDLRPLPGPVTAFDVTADGVFSTVGPR
jgi:hypothetical protein